MVKMYSTRDCADCEQARAYFDARRIRYQEINLEEHPEDWAVVEKITEGRRSTPVFDIDGVYIVGFDVEDLEEVLGISL